VCVCVKLWRSSFTNVCWCYRCCWLSIFSTAVSIGEYTFQRFLVGLYRIYFFPIRLCRPEPDFQIDCNFTNFMCKTLRMYEWFEFLIILCSSYRYFIYTHSRSNLCHSIVSGMYSVSNLIFDRKNQLDILGWDYLMSGEYWLFKSGKTIRLRWDFCRSQISAGFGKSAKIRYSTSFYWCYIFQFYSCLCDSVHVFSTKPLVPL